MIQLDITDFISSAEQIGVSLREIPGMISDAIKEEVLALDPELPKEKDLGKTLLAYMEKPDRKPFVFIIDEWDALIREAKDDPEAQKRYLNLLRGWFKNNSFTPKVVAAAYMTGILPIKKDGSQSAISDFREYSMLNPSVFAGFIGFTEDEVLNICKQHDADFEMMKKWYDGYSFKGVGSVYNPNSVMNAASDGTYISYWTETSAAEGLLD